MNLGETTLHKYRIEKKLGQGAFAEVYLATHLALNGPRALKVLHRTAEGLGSTEYKDFAGRFQLEAMLGNQINSPYVVRVYDFERSGETLILVMEYCPGGSLGELLLRNKQRGEVLEIDQAVKIGTHVALGLAALHAEEAVHRDLKPSNILFDANGLARVSDLGLAEVPGGPSMRSQLSGAGMHTGTPGYMSPEQENGRGLLSPASDVYTLGVVLFEIMSGKNYARQRPGTRLIALRKDTPAWLDELVMKMLDKDPASRPFDGAEAAELLKKEPLPAAAEAKFDEPASSIDPELEKALKTAIDLGEWEEAERLYLELQRQKPNSLTLGVYFKRIERELAPMRAKQAAQEAERQRKAEEEAELVRKEQSRQVAAVEKLQQEKEAATAQARAERRAASEKLHQEQEVEAQRKVRAERLAELGRKKAAEAQSKKRGVQVDLVPGVVLEFVCVPAGEFTMGSNDYDEDPIHKVHLDEYWLCKTPVTNAQYAAYVKASGKPTSSHFKNGQPPKGKENHPVVNVSWEDAAAFCTWASQVSGVKVRLPSEAEWEKGARSSDGRKYPWGNGQPNDKRCNFSNNIKDTTPVGKYSPMGDSPYGCVDMAGNVWEWVADWHDAIHCSQSPIVNPSGPANGTARVLRGGSFDLSGRSVRSASRHNSGPTYRHVNIGFRCAASHLS